MDGRFYASAPSYPHGAIDPVREMGKIAKQKGIGLHVDCCLGGFVLPFARKLDASNIPGSCYSTFIDGIAQRHGIF
jgi:glutamate/tyrosine decarboxylase-like PLP-dependent enzyme